MSVFKLPCELLVPISIFTLVGFATACGSRSEETPVDPVAPPTQVEPSSLIIPVEVPLETLTKQVEEKVPVVLKTKGYEGEPEGVKYTARRGPVLLSAKADALIMRIPVSFEAEAKPKMARGGDAPSGPLRSRLAQRGGPAGGREGGLSCKAQVELTFTSKLEVTSDWTLRSKTTPGPRRWSKPCEMTPLKIDVTKKIDPKLEEKVREVVALMDQKISHAADMRAKIEHAWTSLQTPRPAGDRFWLMMNPQSIAMGPFQGDARALRSTVTLMARPVLVATGSSPTATLLPLPSNTGTAAPGDGFHMALDVNLPFTEATEQARQRLVGQELSGQGKHVKVEDVKISGQGDRFLIEARLAAPVSSTITLQGRPRFDPAAGALKVDGLDYTVETRNVLAKAAEWVLHDTVKAKIAERAQVGLEGRIKEARGRLEQALNRAVSERATSQGTVERLEAQGVYVLPDAFRLVMIAEGKMSMTVK